MTKIVTKIILRPNLFTIILPAYHFVMFKIDYSLIAGKFETICRAIAYSIFNEHVCCNVNM